MKKCYVLIAFDAPSDYDLGGRNYNVLGVYVNKNTAEDISDKRNDDSEEERDGSYTTVLESEIL